MSSPVDDLALIRRLNRTWRETLPLYHTKCQPARQYLRSRGITLKPTPIWADLDHNDAGLNAAGVLKTRAEENGITVKVLLPPLAMTANIKSWDWNDVLNLYGKMGFAETTH